MSSLKTFWHFHMYVDYSLKLRRKPDDSECDDNEVTSVGNCMDQILNQ